MRRTLLVATALMASLGYSLDWPQLQRDAARSGRTTDSVQPNYRARWVWLGPERTLQNRRSNASWSDDLDSRDGYSFPMILSPSITIGSSVQPVVANGRVFIGVQEGRAFGIGAADGTTLWEAPTPGAVVSTAAVSGGVVVFVTLDGFVVGRSVVDGSLAWTHQTLGSFTAAPLVVGADVVVADHRGRVTCLVAASGQIRWVRELGSPVHGGLASDGTRVFVGSEDMRVHSLSLADGSPLATSRIRGQGFRCNWPVVAGGLVWWQSATVPAVGSEYVMDDVLDDSANLASEETNTLRFLAGDRNGGRWPEATPDWRHLFALRATDLTEPFIPVASPVEGCGIPAEPPVVDSQGNIVTWVKTRFPSITGFGAFGTRYSIDLTRINPATGRRIPIDNGRQSGMWMIETDNLYALSIAGDYVWMRQPFRGTQVVRVSDSWHRMVTNRVRYEDGASYPSDIIYANRPENEPQIPQPNFDGRAAVVVVDSRGYIAENYCLTCFEHDQP